MKIKLEILKNNISLIYTFTTNKPQQLLYDNMQKHKTRGY